MCYIYVLKNPVYEAYIVKIGKTKLDPYIRAQQIYWGATGVPEHFEIAFVCKVPDCDLAEKKIHKLLSSYRKNNRREFFHLPVEVAKTAVISVCTELFGRDNISIVVNERGQRSINNIKTEEDLIDEFEYKISYSITLNEFMHALTPSPIGTSLLTQEQKHRIILINKVFAIVFPQSKKETIEDFSRDHNPDREIRIWEHMAKAFMKISENPFINNELKSEAFSLLLMRSMKSTSDVLREHKLVSINEKQARALLKAYELKPKPITATIE
ncbi:GIY-YIG nuclease family protein [Aeromonas veronii]|uniref:GIY-YIG nuclease family protein n=1 Tax=Aeromonas veronii TaxID=654 RepID=UPI0011171CF6|nr:GIY-YIG nuclease family protein [Aeromonas veronii]TNI27145.1 hypothetical protein CF108_12155 [Aeromonas veronii]